MEGRGGGGAHPGGGAGVRFQAHDAAQGGRRTGVGGGAKGGHKKGTSNQLPRKCRFSTFYTFLKNSKTFEAP